MSIYIEGETPQTLRELLKRLFNYKYDGMVKTVATYYDQNCTDEQCDEDRYRSFDDVLELTQTYFPQITKEELIRTLISLDIIDAVGRKMYFFMSSCSDIRRVVIYYHYSSCSYQQADYANQHNSQWSWITLLNDAGIFSQDDYEKVEAERS